MLQNSNLFQGSSIDIFVHFHVHNNITGCVDGNNFTFDSKSFHRIFDKCPYDDIIRVYSNNNNNNNNNNDNDQLLLNQLKGYFKIFQTVDSSFFSLIFISIQSQLNNYNNKTVMINVVVELFSLVRLE